MLSGLMRQSLHVPRAQGRKAGAGVCLLAVVLLWSPLWAAALNSNGMDCCSGGFCPMHGHGQARHAGPTETAPAQSAMDCEHHRDSTGSTDQPTDCSMSCCHERSPNLTASVIFVMPQPTLLSQQPRAIGEPADFAPTYVSPSFAPSSPPPRTL